MGGKSNPSMTNVILLISFVMTLSHIPIIFANSLQGYKEQGLINWINPKRTFRIINEMNTRESLKIHCWSYDDDLGTHVLWPGQYFEWRFRITVLDVITHPTKFTCTFEYRQFKKKFAVFYSRRDIVNNIACVFCLLRATRDGLYGPNFVTHWIKPIEA